MTSRLGLAVLLGAMWALPAAATTLGDATGDGRADLFLRTSNGDVLVAVSTGSGFLTPAVWTQGFVPWRYNVYFADVTGDGLTDLISRNRDTGDIEVFRSTGTSFAYLAGTGPGGVWTYGWYPGWELFFGDTTGDGRADLIGQYTTFDMALYVYDALAGSFHRPSGSAQGSVQWSRVWFADVSGDGRIDYINRQIGRACVERNDNGEVFVRGAAGPVYYENDGSSYYYYFGIGGNLGPDCPAPPATYGYSIGYDLLFADTGGDGRADLIARYVGNGDVFVMRSTGNPTRFVWDSFSPWTYGWGTTYKLLARDFDGDGKADLLGRHKDTGDVFVSLSTGTFFASPTLWLSTSTSVEIY